MVAEKAQEEMAKEGGRSYTTEQVFFLERLHRLLKLRESYGGSAEAWLVASVDRAIYSSLLDCFRYGVAEEAKRLLGRKEGELIPRA